MHQDSTMPAKSQDNMSMHELDKSWDMLTMPLVKSISGTERRKM